MRDPPSPPERHVVICADLLQIGLSATTRLRKSTSPHSSFAQRASRRRTFLAHESAHVARAVPSETAHAYTPSARSSALSDHPRVRDHRLVSTLHANLQGDRAGTGLPAFGDEGLPGPHRATKLPLERPDS